MKINNNVEKISLILLICSSILILGWILYYCQYGFEFTDDAFYLVWVKNPFLYEVSASQFGFFYHPFFVFFDGNIVALRQTNVLITFSLAWIFVYTFLNKITTELNDSLYKKLVVSSGLATSSLVFFSFWLPSPSYNSLALQALIICSTSILLISQKDSSDKNFPWLLLGISVWILFLAKPTSAALLCLLLFVYILFSRKFFIKKLLISSVTFLILLGITALLIDGTILKFIKRLEISFYYSQIIEAGFSVSEVFRVDSVIFDENLLYIFVLTFLTSFFILLFSLVNNKITKNFIVTPILIFIFINYLIISKNFFISIEIDVYKNIIFLVIFLSFVIAKLFFLKESNFSALTLQNWYLIVFFLFIPYIFAFGTNSNYWFKSSLAAIFWLMAACIFISPKVVQIKSWIFILPVVLFIQTVTVFLLQIGLDMPYRQSQALSLNTTKVKIGTSPTPLILGHEFAQYITDAKLTALNAGFVAATPVLDLTGQSPGILYAIEAELLSQPWIIGGTKGSLNLAIEALKEVSCEKIARSWILYEEVGPLTIPVDLLHSAGLNFPDSFKKMGEWRTATGAGGFAISRKQELYAPISQVENLKACTEKRALSTGLLNLK